MRIAPPDEWRQALKAFLDRADLILSGVDEALELTRASDPEAAARALSRQGEAVVVLKDGARGARGYSDGVWLEALPQAVDAVDPVGAGDAFNAGFLAEWIRHGDLARALATGARLGEAAVKARGDTAGLPHLISAYATSGMDVIR